MTIENKARTGLKAPKNKELATAVIYCEARFGEIDGKTANGLIRHSEKYRILSVIDSKKAGLDTGAVLDDKPNGIPILRNLAEAVSHADSLPDYFIFGMAPASGKLSANERAILLEAISCGMNIVNGLYQFLSDDPEFIAASASNNVKILDVRKPHAWHELRLYTGKIKEVTCPRIAILGTDCAIGKRTTASLLNRALNNLGVNAVMVATGQTGLIQGARYGVALDVIPSQFCCGELEASVVEAYEVEDPDVIIIEGQSALSHLAFNSSSCILKGGLPDAVILQHAPGRQYRCDFEDMPMPSPQYEIKLIQTLAETKIIGLTINHENMSDDDVSKAIKQYEQELNIPVTAPLKRPVEDLVEMVLLAFPELKQKQTAHSK